MNIQGNKRKAHVSNRRNRNEGKSPVGTETITTNAVVNATWPNERIHSESGIADRCWDTKRSVDLVSSTLTSTQNMSRSSIRIALAVTSA